MRTPDSVEGARPDHEDANGGAYPSFSVIIDTYNYAHFIRRAIDSVLNQDYRASTIEIIVVDDGSTDDTRRVVQENYGDRVRYLHKPNGGQASALNLGFDMATGDVVCVLDADDYFYPDKIRVVADIFRRHPHVGLVYHEFDIVDGYGASLRKPTPEPTWTGYTIPLDRVPSQLRSLILLGHPWSCVLCGLAVRRSLLTTLRIPEEVAKYHADLFLYLVLPFMTAVEVVATSHAAYVHHGANAELFRSSRESRESQARELAYARRYVEEHFGVRFLTYVGRSMYGDDGVAPVRGFERLAVAAGEARQIAAAEVEPAIKLAAGLKLAASLLLPGPSYEHARALWSRARQR